jgi:hypothetical protein
VHKFKIGQTVQFRPAPGLTNAAPGHYVVTRLLPERDGKLGYQIKSSNESHDRTASEDQLTGLELPNIP